MKKLSTTTKVILTTFSILLLNLQVKSQNNTITIGNMSTNYVTATAPFNNYYKYSWSDNIYLTSEIGQAGKITQIAFYVYEGTNYTMSSQKILMRETSSSSFSNGNYPGESGFTTVYNGSITYNWSGNSGWQVVTLSTPFTYDGLSNLEVLCENQAGSYTNNYNFFDVTTGYSSNRIKNDYNDASFPSSCVNCGTYTNLTNIQLTMVCTSTMTLSPSSATICNGSGTSLTASGVSTYSWTPATGLSGTTGASVTASPTVTTVYSVAGTDGSSCIQTQTVTVTVNPLPTVSISPSSATICSGGNTTLTASGASTYSWSPSTGLSASTGASVTANPSATTTYTVTGTGSNGCTKTQTVLVTVNNPATLTFSPSAPAICIGSTTTVTASGASTYTWSPSTGLNTTTGATVAANPTTTTTYSVNYTSSNGCAGTTTLSVAVNALPTLTLSPSSPAVCNGGTVALTASGASTYTWSPATNLSATTGASVNANPTTATNYTLTGTNANGCVNTKAFTVNVNGLPTISVSPTSATICVGNNTSLTASGASTYTWTPSSSLNNANSANVTASPNATTTYTVSGTNANGCVGTTTVTVNVNPLPTINVTASPTAICVGASSNLSASGANTYTWSPATGLNNTNTANVTANPNATTNYTVNGTDANGCIGNQTINLVVNPLPSISISPSSPVVLGGQGATITASGASTYTWSPSTNLSSTSGSTVTANPEITTAYTLTGTSAAGCVNQTAFSVGIELWQQVADSAKAPIFYQGNVGINNNNPQAALDVIGNEKLSGNLSVGGTITDPSFGGSGNRILQTDNAGVITPISSGTAAQVLYGNGTWGALPTQPIQTSGNDAYFTGGNFGIGNANPAFPLDVTGNARISGNLTVGGINATGSNLDVTTPAVFTNSVTLSSLGNGTSNQRLGINAGGNIVASAGASWDQGGNVTGSEQTLGSKDGFDVPFIAGGSPSTNASVERMRIIATGNAAGDVVLNNNPGATTPTKTELILKTFGGSFADVNHGLGYNSNLDGPILYGYSGGGLGINQTNTSGGVTNVVLNWLANGRVGIGTPAPDAMLHVSTQNTTAGTPGLIVDNGYPIGGPAEFIINSNGTTVVNAIATPNQDVFDINFQEAQSLGGGNYTNQTTIPFFKTIFDGVSNDGKIGIGGANPNTNGNTVNAYKMLTVNGDVSFANYNNNTTGNHMNGLTALEILGNNGIPTARGISVDNDPAGDLNFFVNSAQHGNSDQMAEFHFKDGSNTSYDLMTLNQGGELILSKLPGIGSYTGQLKTLLVDANGKLVPGSAVANTSSTSWNVGGNSVGASGALGTNDGDLIFVSGADPFHAGMGLERMRIDHATGNLQMAALNQLLIKGPDANHGLGYNVNIDGPFLYGWTGGALGTNHTSNSGGVSNMALQWDAQGDIIMNSTSSTNTPLTITNNSSGTLANLFQISPNGVVTITETNGVASFPQGVLTINSGNLGELFKVLDNGAVYAKEIYVQMPPFPDYVFEKNYKLMPLNEVEKFIQQNKHLPNVISAEEVDKKGGAPLGQLQKVNLEKTEELYLYIIELNKKVEKLEEEMSKLKNK